MNDEKKSWLDKAGAVHLWKTIEAILGTKVDKIEGFGLSSNDYTTEEKKKLASLSDPDVATTENNGLMSSADKAKLDGIEAGANNYTHPTYEAKQAGLYRISVDNTGHVATADKMTSEELAAEGVSPVDHTHDLGKLVDTLETNADAIEDADTVMVGATVTSDDGSATTKYTRRPLDTLQNQIKAKADVLYAAVGHNHKVNELENYDTHVYNPTLNRTKRTVLAAPTAADGPATFRALDKNDVGLGNVDNTPDSEKTVLKSASLSGFTSRSGQKWGNQTGTFIHGEDDETGGSFAFRRDNPENGQMSMIIDGRFYQNEGQYMCLDTNNYSDYAATKGHTHNSLSPTVTFTGGNDNTTGYRLIGQVTFGQWSNYRCVMIVKSRHQGAGIVSVCMGNNTSTINQANVYSEIKYWGPQNSGNVIHSDAYKVYISADGKTGYLFWQYNDYSNTEAYVISSDFTISNGTWMTSIGSGYGSLWSTTQVNVANKTTYVKDIGNSSDTTFAYSKSGMNYGDYTWLAAWNGYELRAVNKNQFATANNGVTASGQNYVRFGDGTQICWGSCGNNSFSSFGAAFANTDYRIGMSEWKSSSWENYAIGSKSTTGVTLRSEDNTMEYIAIGRWK